MFNKPHYDYIAKSLKDSKPDGEMNIEVWERTVRTIAHDLKDDNVHFSYPAFYIACTMKRKSNGKPRHHKAKGA